MISALFLIFPVLTVPAVVKGRLYATPLPLLALLATLVALLGLLHSLQAQQIVLALLSAALGASILHLQFLLPNAGPSILILPGTFLVCATLLSIAPHHAHMAPFLSLAFVLTTVGTSLFIFSSRDSRDLAPQANQSSSQTLPPEYTEKPPRTLFSNGCICHSDPETLITSTSSPHGQSHPHFPLAHFFALLSGQLAYTIAFVFTIPAARLSPPSRPLVPFIINYPLPDRVDVFWILQETFFITSLLCVLAAYYCRSKSSFTPSPSPLRASVHVHAVEVPLSSTPTPSVSSFTPGAERNTSKSPPIVYGVINKVIQGTGHDSSPTKVAISACTSVTPLTSPVLKLPPRPKSVHHVQRRGVGKQQHQPLMAELSKSWSASWACPSTIHCGSMYAHDFDEVRDCERGGEELDWTDLEDPFAPPPPPPLPPPPPPQSPVPSIGLSSIKSAKRGVNFNINTGAYRVGCKKHDQQQQQQQTDQVPSSSRKLGKRMNAWGRLTLPLPLGVVASSHHPSASSGVGIKKTKRKKMRLSGGDDSSSTAATGLFKGRVRATASNFVGGTPAIGMGTEVEDALIAQKLLVQLGGGMKNEK